MNSTLLTPNGANGATGAIDEIKSIESQDEYNTAYTRYMDDSLDRESMEGAELRHRLREYRTKVGMTDRDYGQFRNEKKETALMTLMQSEWRPLTDDEKKSVSEDVSPYALDVYGKADERGKATLFTSEYADAVVGGDIPSNLMNLGYHVKAKDWNDEQEIYQIIRNQSKKAYDDHVAYQESIRQPMLDETNRMVDAVSQGNEYHSLMVEMADMNKSGVKAAAWMKRMAYGDDRVSPQAQGVSTGIDGLVNYGYSETKEGGWVEELAVLKHEDKDAYGLVMEALSRLASHREKKDVPFLEKFGRGFVEGVLSAPARWVDSQVEDFYDMIGVGLADKHKDIPHYKTLVGEVAKDLQSVRKGAGVSSREGFTGWLDDFGSFGGGSFAFAVGSGVPAVLGMAQESFENYRGEGQGDVSRWTGLAEGIAVGAVNRMGVNNLGKVFGKRYDVISQRLGEKLGNIKGLSRIQSCDKWFVQYPRHLVLGNMGELTQEVVEPFAQYIAGNVVSFGNGMEWQDATMQAKAVFEPRTLGHMLTYGSLMGGLGRFQNARTQGQFIQQQREREMKLAVANSPSTLRQLNMSEEAVQQIINEVSPDKKLRLMEREVDKLVKEGGRDVEDVAIVLPPESDYVQRSMKDGLMPQYRMLASGEYERTDLDGQSTIISAELATKNMAQEAGQLIKNDLAMFRQVDLAKATVDWFVESDPNLEIVQVAKKLDMSALESMREAAMNGEYEVLNEYDPSGKFAEYAQSDEGKEYFAVMPKSLRNRINLEAERGGVSTKAMREFNKSGEGFHARAMNYRDRKGRAIIGFYNNDLSAYDLVEERAELYVKQELEQGRSMAWLYENLMMTQREFKAQGVKGWQLLGEDASLADMNESKIVEAISKLSKSVFAQEYQERKLPEAVRKFLEVISALCNEVKDWIRLGSAFKKLEAAGKVDSDFASLVYGASEGLKKYRLEQAEERIKQEPGRKKRRYSLAKKLAGWVDFAIDQGDLEVWNRQMDDYLTGKWSKFKPLDLGATPDVLRAIGVDEKPIVIATKTLDKIMGGKHDLSEDNVRALAEAIHDPVLVMNSWTENDSLVILTSVRSAKGNVMVALHLDKKTNIGEVHNVASAYSRNSNQTLIDELTKGNCLYLHKKKALSWARFNRLQLPKVASQKGKAKILEPEDVIKWKSDQYDTGVDFALGEEVGLSLEAMADKARVSAVKEYFGTVLERTDREFGSLRRLFEGRVDDKELKLLEARAALRVALNELPSKAREKVKNYEGVVDALLDGFAKGKVNADESLDDATVKRISRLFGVDSEVFTEFSGRSLEDVVLKMYERCNDVINNHARDEMHGTAVAMIKSFSPEVDKSTMKYKVGPLGARAQEYLQDVLKPIFMSTKVAAHTRIGELQGELRACQDQVSSLSDNDKDAAMQELERTEKELFLWESFGACKSLSAERMLGALSYLEQYLSAANAAWVMENEERVQGWKKERDSVKFLEKSTLRSRQNAMDAYNGTAHSKDKKGMVASISESVENPVKALERWGAKSGASEYFNGLAKDVVRCRNEINYDAERDAMDFRAKLKALVGAKDEMALNAWYEQMNKRVPLKTVTTPFGFKRIDLTLEHAAEIYANRKKNVWYGSYTYTQQSIDALCEAYESWLSGEDKSTKWLHVEEYFAKPGEEISMSPSEMMHILMTSERFYARDIYHQQGLSALYPEMRQILGKQGEAVMDMLFDQYAKLGDRVRPLYEERYGVPFSKNRRYAPLRWITVENLKDIDLAQLLQATGDVAVGRVDGFLSKTQDHRRDVDLTTSALNLFWQHHSAVTNWVHTQELVRKTRYHLSDVKFAQDMLVNLGGEDYLYFNNLLNNLEKGGIAKAQAQGAMMEKLANGMNTMSISVLSGQLSSLLKQTSNVFNGLYGCDLSLMQWARAMARVLSGKSLYTIKEFYESDIFAPRKNAFANSVLIGLKRQVGGQFGWVESMSEVPMSWLGKSDTYTNAVSFAAVFDHYYREGQKSGMSVSEAKEYAISEVEMGLGRIAAPVDFTQKARVLNDDNSVANRALFWLQVEALGKLSSVTSHISRAHTEYKRGEKGNAMKHARLAVRSWLLQGMAQQTLGYLVGVLIGDPDDDERLNPLNYLPSVILGPMNGLPMIGDLFSKPMGWLLDEPLNDLSESIGLEYRYKTYAGGMNQFIFNWKDIEGICDYVTGDTDISELANMKELSRKGSKAAGLGAVMSSMMRGKKKMVLTSAGLAMASVLNFSKYVAGLAENLEEWLEK